MKISILILLFSLQFFSVLVVSKLSIVGPQGLQDWWNSNEEETHVSLAAFGSNPWGRTIFASMELANPLDACNYIKEDDSEFKKVHIMVAKRGSCKFVQKAHYAQLAGAEMLVIVDNIDEDVDTRLMIDDGVLGQSVHIPVGLLGQTAGDKIIQSLQSEDETVNKITALFDFVLPQADTVEYHLWLSSSTSTSFKLVEEWKPYYDKLKDVTRMEPLYAHFHDFPNRGIHPDPTNCVCGRKYCAPDPDGDKENNGRDVLLEDLRQLCLFHEFSEVSWWTYMTNYDTFCLDGGKLEDCSKNSLLSLGVDWNLLKSCVERSFDDKNLDKCTSNMYLDTQYQYLEQDGVIIFPSASINNNTIRGNVIPPTGIFEAICVTFTTMPKTCREYFHMPDAMTSYPGGLRKSHLGIIISAVIFLIVFTLIVTICYRRWLKRELRRQMLKDVNVAVAQYIAFKDNDEREPSRIME